jgi:hypothetical protein
MALEIPAGVRSSGDMAVKADVPKPARKPKEVVLDKRQRAARQQENRVRKEQISHERASCDGNLSRLTPERSRLKDNLQSEEKRAQAKIDAMMADHFGSSSGGKLVDQILKSEMIEPKLQQLRGNISKLDHSIAWHRAKLQALSREEHQLDKEMDNLNCDDLAEECYQAYIAWVDSWFVAEHQFEKFKQSIREARNLDRDFAQRLPRFGKSDHCFVLVCDSKLRPELIDEASMATLVDDLSKNYSLKDNRFYSQSTNVNVTRRLKVEEPLRRDDFNTGRKIGRIG